MKKGKSNLTIVKSYLDGERPFVKIGWDQNLIERKNGETWTDSKGHEWIQKNGYKKRINKSYKIHPDNVRQLCSDCNMDMKWGNKLDDKIFNKTGRCYDCNIKYETLLKRDGKFSNYEQVKVLKNQLGFCKDLKLKLEESIDFLKNSSDDIIYINEDGSKETWKDTTRKTVLENAKTDLIECNAAIDRINNLLSKLNTL
jgi:hypothetical protein